MNKISPLELKRLLVGDEELALIDVREQGAFSKSHLLFAVCVPLSRLELLIGDLVPRKDTGVVIVDDSASDDFGDRAFYRLREFGYKNVVILDGGVAAWESAGFELFSGVNVPSKAFGEFVEYAYETPRLGASEVKAMLDEGRNMVIVDSRPFEEYHRMNIPTATDMPGAELAFRIHDIAPDPETFVVVNCAGRTRSIIGAQSLINAGIPNPVAALKDGTMGWHLARGPKCPHGGCDKMFTRPRQWCQEAQLGSVCYLFPSRQGRSRHLSTRQYARLVDAWVSEIGLDPSGYGTHSMRRTKPTLIYQRTKNLRAVQLLLARKSHR